MLGVTFRVLPEKNTLVSLVTFKLCSFFFFIYLCLFMYMSFFLSIYFPVGLVLHCVVSGFMSPTGTSSGINAALQTIFLRLFYSIYFSGWRHNISRIVSWRKRDLERTDINRLPNYLLPRGGLSH